MRWLLGVALGVSLASCDDQLYGEAVIGVSSCKRDPPLDYENFGKGFLDQHCTGCHSSYLIYVPQPGEPERDGDRRGAPTGLDFDTWLGVLTWVDEIHFESVATQQMPQSGGPSAEDRKVFGEWLTCEVMPAARAAEREGLIPAEVRE